MGAKINLAPKPETSVSNEAQKSQYGASFKTFQFG